MQHRGVEGRGDRLELCLPIGRGAEVARGDGDLDLDRQEPRPGEVCGRLPRQPGDYRQGGFGPSLGEAEEGQLATRSPAQLLGASEGLFGPVELAQPPADVADLGERRAAVADVAADQLLAGLEGLALGLGQRPASLQDHGPVHAADPREDGERVLLGPGQGGGGPFGRSVEVPEVLTGADEAAVHLAGRVRPEAALDGEEHRLVEVAHALRHLALVDEDPPRGLQRLRLEVGGAEPAGQRDHLGGQPRTPGRGPRRRGRPRPPGAAGLRARRSRRRPRAPAGRDAARPRRWPDGPRWRGPRTATRRTGRSAVGRPARRRPGRRPPGPRSTRRAGRATTRRRPEVGAVRLGLGRVDRCAAGEPVGCGPVVARQRRPHGGETVGIHSGHDRDDTGG